MVGGEIGLIFYYLYYTCPRISAVLLCLHIGLSFVQTTCKHILQAGQLYVHLTPNQIQVP